MEKARSQAALVVAAARRAMGLKAQGAGRAADRAQRLSLLAALAAVAVSLAVLIMTARSADPAAPDAVGGGHESRGPGTVRPAAGHIRR